MLQLCEKQPVAWWTIRGFSTASTKIKMAINKNLAKAWKYHW
jgi:hypothetical protein